MPDRSGCWPLALLSARNRWETKAGDHPRAPHYPWRLGPDRRRRASALCV